MNTFDHPIVKSAMNFVDLNVKCGLPDTELYLVVEFAVWLSKQVDMDTSMNNVVNFSLEKQKRKAVNEK